MKSRIRKLFKSANGRKLRKPQIRREVCRKNSDNQRFKTAFKILILSGEILREEGGLYSLNNSNKTIKGTISVSSGGYGFINVESAEDDYFVPSRDLNNAITGDTVEAIIISEKNSKGPVAAVKKIIEEEAREFTGEITKDGKTFKVLPFRTGCPEMLIVNKEKNLQEGDVVKIRLLPRNTSKNLLYAEVLEKIGNGGNLNAILDGIVSEFGLSDDYTEEHETQAANLEERSISRTNLTSLVTTTVDPIDAKDFDDALSFVSEENGITRIAVHIADVAAYLAPGSLFDEMARKRSFTSYLPGRMLPMLPHYLVKNKCSLTEGIIKPAHTVLLDINEHGKIIYTERFHSQIKVDKRLAYEDVQKFANNKFQTNDWDENVQHAVKKIYQLSHKMRQYREKHEQFLPIHAAEIRVLCDFKEMKISGLRKETGTRANEMVEEYMLAANAAVAEELIKNRTPGIYRIHGAPEEDSLFEYKFKLEAVYGIKTDNLDNKSSIIKHLNKIADDDRGDILIYDFLRIMQRAVYSNKPLLHYGLGKIKYSHFTSPIRRYSDLIVHQQLWEKEINGSLRTENDCQALSEQISSKEKIADDAYRAAMARFKLSYIFDLMQVEGILNVEGIIATISKSMIKVYLNEFGIISTIYLKDVESDRYYADKNNSSITGKFHNKTFTCGSIYQFKIIKIDYIQKNVILELL